jgi:hypothetical protein
MLGWVALGADEIVRVKTQIRVIGIRVIESSLYFKKRVLLTCNNNKVETVPSVLKVIKAKRQQLQD